MVENSFLILTKLKTLNIGKTKHRRHPQFYAKQHNRQTVATQR